MYHPTVCHDQFWVAALLGIALIEYNQISKGFAEPDSVTGVGGMKAAYNPGDLGFDPLGLKPTEEDALDTMQTKELNNGRLAVSEDGQLDATEFMCRANIDSILRGHFHTPVMKSLPLPSLTYYHTGCVHN